MPLVETLFEDFLCVQKLKVSRPKCAAGVDQKVAGNVGVFPKMRSFSLAPRQKNLARGIAVAVLRCSRGKTRRCEMAQQGCFSYLCGFATANS